MGGPPWEVMVLVSHRLDPKSLAVACCVCKSWSVSMSSDHLWQPICAAHFPSLSSLSLTATAAVSYRRLYAIAHSSSKRRLEVKTPSRPHLSLSDLIFAVSIFIKSCNSNVVALTVAGDELDVRRNEVFKFDLKVNCCCERPCCTLEAMEEVKMSWNIVVKGWRGVFTMMDCDGKVSFSPGSEGWFSEELPSPGCCSSSAATSGIVADLKVGFCTGRESGIDGGKVRIEKVSLGILSILNWRYITLQDGLRYLQHFLLPFDNA